MLRKGTINDRQSDGNKRGRGSSSRMKWRKKVRRKGKR